MQTALVPYEPHARDPQSARAGFADFLRRSRRPQEAPVGTFAGRSDVENGKQHARDPDMIKMLRVQSRTACANQCGAVVSTLQLIFAAAVLIGLGVVVVRVNDSIDRIDAMVAPHTSTLVDSTVKFMHNMGDSMTNVAAISQLTSDLAAKELGPTGGASVALNSTAVIAQRLARFMEKPTLKLSLGGDDE